MHEGWWKLLKVTLPIITEGGKISSWYSAIGAAEDSLDPAKALPM